MLVKEPIFCGACTAVVTPFDDTGAVDYAALEALLEEQIQSGIDAICICGTTGETATLSTREYISVVETCVKRIGGRIPVIAGAGSNDTAKAAYLAQHAQEAGADALLIVTPYYNKTSQPGLLKHYDYIAERVEKPIILYNVPSRTGVSFTAHTYQRLAENPKINGVKEASGNLSLVVHTRNLCGPDFTIWSGNDDHVVPMMSLGAKGVISVAANLVPQAVVKMTHLCLENDFQAACQIQLEYADLIDALFSDVNPIPIKAALNLLNKKAGTLRLPLCEMSEEKLETLKNAMLRIGLLA